MSTSNKMKLTLSTKISQNDKLSAYYSEENTPTGAENSMDRSKSIFGDDAKAKKVAVSGFVAGGLRFCSTPSEKKTQGGDSPTNSDGGEDGPSFSKVGTIKPSRFYKEASKGGKPGGADGEEGDMGRNSGDTSGKHAEESKGGPDQSAIEAAFKASGGHKNKHIRNVVDASIHRDSSLGALDDKKKGSNLENHPWRHLIFGPHIEAERFKKHMIVTYKGLTYATKCLKGPSDKFIQSKQITLEDTPDNIGKKTLVLDLDETLIHTCTTKDHPDVLLTTRDEANTEYAIPLKVRPYLHEFLKRMSKLFEIVVFTASASYYANSIIDYIDPSKRLIADILARSNCMETKNGFVIKDLRIIKNRNMKDIILVDNLSHSFGLQIENGIPILEFIDNPHDQELKHLAEYLTEIAKVDDVREYNKEKLRLRELAAVPEQNLI